jgi:hypothetical protein
VDIDKKLEKYKPECLFCRRYIVRPVLTKTEFGEILSGRCECGAIYVCDTTGHNAGEAYSEALALMKGDWDIAVLNPDEDYEVMDMDYDLRTHMRIYSRGLNMQVGKLIFVKAKSAEEKSHASAQNIQTEMHHQGEKHEEGGLKLKSRIKKFLDLKSFDDIVKISHEDKRAISALISLSYDKNDVQSWRAIEAIGLIACDLVKDRIDILRDTIRKLFWSMTDESGGIGWSAPEMIGEIVRSNPDEFIDIIPILWSHIDEEMFRPGVVWAMCRIADVRPDLVNFILNDLQYLIEDKNPAVRGYAASAMGKLLNNTAEVNLRKLLEDTAPIMLYSDGELQHKTVRELAEKALNKKKK